ERQHTQAVREQIVRQASDPMLQSDDPLVQPLVDIDLNAVTVKEVLHAVDAQCGLMAVGRQVVLNDLHFVANRIDNQRDGARNSPDDQHEQYDHCPPTPESKVAQ